jgi:hypothetical protein
LEIFQLLLSIQRFLDFHIRHPRDYNLDSGRLPQVKSASIIAASVVVSVVISVCLAIGYDRIATRKSFRTRDVEIVDERGRIRIKLDASEGHARIRLLNTTGQEIMEMNDKSRVAGIEKGVPQLSIKRPTGTDDAMVLTLDENNQPVLYFNESEVREGVVVLGHVSESDVAENPEGGWGLQVRGPGLKVSGIGFLKSGQAVEPLRRTPVAKSK